MSSLHRIYVHADQMTAVKASLEECGMAFERHRLQRVSAVNHLSGLSCGTFIVMRNYRHPVPTAIMNAVEQLGLVVIEIDDRFARQRHSQR